MRKNTPHNVPLIVGGMFSNIFTKSAHVIRNKLITIRYGLYTCKFCILLLPTFVLSFFLSFFLLLRLLLFTHSGKLPRLTFCFPQYFGQRSVTATSATRSPWSILSSFGSGFYKLTIVIIDFRSSSLSLCLLLITHFGETSP